MANVYDFTLTVGADDSAANQVLDILNKNLLKATKKDNVISITADASNVENALKQIAEMNPTVGANIELVIDQTKINKEISFLNSILNSKTELDPDTIASKFKTAFTSGIKNSKLGDILADEVGNNSRSIENVQTAVDKLLERISSVDISKSMDISEMTNYVRDLETANVLIKEISKNSKLSKVNTSGITSILDSINLDEIYSTIGKNIFMNNEELLKNLQSQSVENIQELQDRIKDILKYGAGYEIVSTEELDSERKKLSEMEQAFAQTNKSASQLESELYDVAESIEEAFDEDDIEKADKLQKQLLILAAAYKQVAGVDLFSNGAEDSLDEDLADISIAVQDAKKEFADFNIEIVSKEDIANQRMRIQQLEDMATTAIKNTNAEAKPVEINIEPTIDPNEFAQKVSQQLTVPAQIEVEGKISDPARFAWDIAGSVPDVALGVDFAPITDEAIEELQKELEIIKPVISLEVPVTLGKATESNNESNVKKFYEEYGTPTQALDAGAFAHLSEIIDILGDKFKLLNDETDQLTETRFNILFFEELLKELNLSEGALKVVKSELLTLNDIMPGGKLNLFFGDSLKVLRESSQHLTKINDIFSGNYLVNHTDIENAEELLSISEQVETETKQAASAIEQEGLDAKKAAEYKEAFAKANKEVASVSEEVSDSVKTAAEEIASEGDAAKKATDLLQSLDTMDFSDNRKVIEAQLEYENNKDAVDKVLDRRLAEEEKINKKITDDNEKLAEQQLQYTQKINHQITADKEKQSEQQLQYIQKVNKKIADDNEKLAEQQLQLDQKVNRQVQSDLEKENESQLKSLYDAQEQKITQIYKLKQENLSLEVQETEAAKTKYKQNEEYIASLEKEYDSLRNTLPELNISEYQSEREVSLGKLIDQKIKELENTEEQIIARLNDATAKADTTSTKKDTAKAEKVLQQELANSYKKSKTSLEQINKLRIKNLSLDKNDIEEQNKIIQNNQKIAQLYKDYNSEIQNRSSNKFNTQELEDELALYKQEQTEIYKQAKEQSNLNKIKTVATEQNKIAATAYKKLASNAKTYYTLLNKEANESLTGEEAKTLSELRPEWEAAAKGVGKYTIAVKGTEKSIKDAQAAMDKFFSAGSDSVAADIDKRFQKYQSKIDSIAQNASSYVYIGADGSTETLASESGILKEIINTIKQINDNPIDISTDESRKRIGNLENQVQSFLSNVKKIAKEVSVTNIQNEVSKYLNDNTKLSFKFRQRLEEISSELKYGITDDRLRELYTDFQKIQIEARAAGQEGRNAFDAMSQRLSDMDTKFIAQLLSWQDLIRYIRTVASTVVELNTALTEMRKVSDESLSSLQAYQNISFDIADDVGTTGLQIQQSTADFMRLGEALDEASESASTANLLMNVSEFESIDDATDSLIAMSAAYDDLDKIDIVNKLNEIGNNYSISTDGIATALQDSASALVTASNDIDEAIALITAGNAVVQDPDKVGKHYA